MLNFFVIIFLTVYTKFDSHKLINMHLFLIYTLLLLLIVSCESFGGMAGGWKEGNPTDPNVISVAKFAIHAKYGDTAALKKVVKVKSQVVRGSKYDVNVETLITKDDKCVAEKYIVWDDLGTKKLISHEFLAENCGH